MPIQSSHILICRTDNIGDVVLTLPMVARLRQLNPKAKISFLCRAYAAPVVRYCTDVDEVIEVESIADSVTDYLKKSDIDTVILAQPDQKLAVAAFRAGIRHRIGNARQKLYLLFYCNRRVRFSKGLSEDHEAQINFCFLRPYGDYTIPDRSELPALYHFDIPTDAGIAQTLQPHAFNLILHTKSNGHGREWPIGHYQSLAQKLASDPGAHLWLTGSDKEGQWLEENAEELLRLPNVTNVCGTMTLAQLAVFIKQADGLIASGTGPLHLSAAIGQRTLGLFPPTRPMHPGRWAAIGARSQNLAVDESCPDCRRIQEPTCDCMRRITPDTVYGIVKTWQQEKAAE
jgi:ADP-heptose:LPS heptosyltransferase